MRTNRRELRRVGARVETAIRLLKEKSSNADTLDRKFVGISHRKGRGTSQSLV